MFEKRKVRDRELGIESPGERAEEKQRILDEAMANEIARRYGDNMVKKDAEMREKAKMRERTKMGEDDERKEGETSSSHASKPPLRSTNTKRHSVPSAVRSRPKTVPDARLRPGERRPEG